ncbi:MAG: fibronectin type III domain-containing protein [Bifidobacteriaceae bacterium]|jgi:hypothetical protein|nr:fibronectin type III domain-containing protein [Bifidobacteriaceae bacterium]
MNTIPLRASRWAACLAVAVAATGGVIATTVAPAPTALAGTQPAGSVNASLNALSALGFSTDPEDLAGYDSNRGAYQNNPFGSREGTFGTNYDERLTITQNGSEMSVGLSDFAQRDTKWLTESANGFFSSDEQVISSVTTSFLPYQAEASELTRPQQAVAVVYAAVVGGNTEVRLRVLDFTDSATAPKTAALNASFPLGPGVLARVNGVPRSDLVLNMLAVQTTDFTGDGLADLLVNLPAVDAAGNLVSPVGRLVVLERAPGTYVDREDAWTVHDAPNEGFTPDELEVVDYTGSLDGVEDGTAAPNMVSLTTGDVNGDGADDVLAAFSYFETIDGQGYTESHATGDRKRLYARASLSYQLVGLAGRTASGAGPVPSVFIDQTPATQQPKRPGVLVTRNFGSIDLDTSGSAASDVQVIVAGTGELQAVGNTEWVASTTQVGIFAYHALDATTGELKPLPHQRLGGSIPGAELNYDLYTAQFRRGAFLRAIADDPDAPGWFEFVEYTSEKSVVDSAREHSTYFGRENLPTAIAEMELDNQEPARGQDGYSGYQGGIGLFTDGSITPIGRRQQTITRDGGTPDDPSDDTTEQFWYLHVGGDQVQNNAFYQSPVGLLYYCGDYSDNRAGSGLGTKDWYIDTVERCVYAYAKMEFGGGSLTSNANTDLYSASSAYWDNTYADKWTRSVYTAGNQEYGGQHRTDFIHGVQSGAVEGSDESIKWYPFGHIRDADKWWYCEQELFSWEDIRGTGGCFFTRAAALKEQVQYLLTPATPTATDLSPDATAAKLVFLDGIADFDDGQGSNYLGEDHRFRDEGKQQRYLNYIADREDECQRFSQCMQTLVLGAKTENLNTPQGKDLVSVLFPADIDAVTYYYKYYQVEYSEPSVIALLAAPPRFKDLEALDDGDAFSDSSTSFSLSTGSSQETTSTGTLTAGIFAEYDHSISVFGIKLATFKASVEATYTHEWERAKQTSRTTTTTFSTHRGEDTVALTVIPTDAYYFDVAVPDGKGGVGVASTFAIKAPYAPITTAWEVGYYNEIAERYGLPQIGDDVIKHTVGRPETYAQYADDPSFTEKADFYVTPGYGTASTAQELTFGEESTQGSTNGFNITTSVCAGGGGACVGVTAGGGYTEGRFYTDFTETTFAGEQKSLPRDPSWPAGREPYRLSWRLQAKYIDWPRAVYDQCDSCGEGYMATYPQFPYITYGVKQVRSGPALPDNLRVNGATSRSVTLAWENPVDPANEATHYQVYVDEGYGLQTLESWRVPATETGFAVNGLAPETTYGFALVAENENALSPFDRSVMSTSVSARTKVFGTSSPVVHMDTPLVVVPIGASARLGVSVEPVGADLNAVSYQWERASDQGWVTLTGATQATHRLDPVGAGDFGMYRCVVTERISGKPVMVYSATAEIRQGKARAPLGLRAEAADGAKRVDLNHYITLRADLADIMPALPPTGLIKVHVTGPEDFLEELSFRITATQGELVAGAESRWGARRWNADSGTAYLPVGDYQAWASYEGDTSYQAATSPTAQFTVYDSDAEPPTAIHTVEARAEAGGSINPAGETPVTDGNSLTVTAVPAEGYVFTGFTVDSASAPVTGSDSYTFTAVGADHQIEAHFLEALDTADQVVAFDGNPHHYQVRLADPSSGLAPASFALSYELVGEPVAVPTAVGTYTVHLTRPADSVASAIDVTLPTGLTIVGAVPAAPGTPTIAESGDQGDTITVTWAPSAHDGGLGLSYYQVTLVGADGTEISQVVNPGATTAVFNQLAPGAYTATVEATNAMGSSSASEPSELLGIGQATVQRLVVSVQATALAKGEPVVATVEGFDQYGNSLGDLTHEAVLTTETRAVFVEGTSTLSRFVYTIWATYQVPGTYTVLTSAPVEVEVFDPASLVVAVSGTARVGETLLAHSLIDWPLELQWVRDGVDIPGATDTSYKLTAADAGTAIAVRATADYGSGELVKTSEPLVIGRASPTLTAALVKQSVTTEECAQVVVQVAAEGVEDIDGELTVTVGDVTATGQVSNSEGTVTLPLLPAGTYEVKITYGGSTAVEPAFTVIRSLTVTQAPGTDPPSTDPPGTDPPGTDPPGTDPPGTDPPGTDPSNTDPPGTEPSNTDPPGTDPPGSNPPGTDPPGANPPGSRALPVTGSGSLIPLAGAAGGLLVAGWLLMAAARRRRRMA